ncbi:MAG TPA: hypothetical protein VND67_09165 [Acidimicrobiales bacterium]|nr:hypothetical protein [Acidimicrobiales bacterium]
MTTDSSSVSSMPATSGPSVEAGRPEGVGSGDVVTRYRCSGCGNLTRFNVVTNRRTRAFHHFSIGGDLSIEEVEILDESVEEVSCRWCGNGDAVVVLEDGAPEAP